MVCYFRPDEFSSTLQPPFAGSLLACTVHKFRGHFNPKRIVKVRWKRNMSVKNENKARDFLLSFAVLHSAKTRAKEKTGPEMHITPQISRPAAGAGEGVYCHQCCHWWQERPLPMAFAAAVSFWSFLPCA